MFGVYIHFPYCRKRCPYCDFAVHARARIPHDAYADAVVAELGVRAPLFAGRQLVSLYFGGGTPGLWRADCVAARDRGGPRHVRAVATGGAAGGHRRGQPRRSVARAPGRAGRRRRQPPQPRRPVAQRQALAHARPHARRPAGRSGRRRRARRRLHQPVARPHVRAAGADADRAGGRSRRRPGAGSRSPERLQPHRRGADRVWRPAAGRPPAGAGVGRRRRDVRAHHAAARRRRLRPLRDQQLGQARPARAAQHALLDRRRIPRPRLLGALAFAGCPTAAASASAPCAPSTPG